MQSSIWWGLFEWSLDHEVPLFESSLVALLCAANFAGEGAIIVFFAMGCLITCLPVSWDAFETLACGRVIWCLFASEPLDSTFCGGGENRTIRHSAITGAYSPSVEPRFSWASEPRWQKAVAAMQEAEESRVSCEFRLFEEWGYTCKYFVHIYIYTHIYKWWMFPEVVPQNYCFPHQSR